MSLRLKSLLLLSAVLAVSILPVSLAGTLPVWADDDDGGGGGDDDGGGGDDGGDGDGDGDGDDGGSRTPSTRNDSPSQARSDRGGTRKARTQQRARQSQKPQRLASRQRPILVAMDLDDADIREARRLGFEVLSSETLSAVGIRVYRLRIPRNVTTTRARAILRSLGSTAADLNTIYRPQSDSSSCTDGKPCNPLQLVGLQPGLEASCNASPAIGLIETTVNTEHPSLNGQKIDVLEFRPRGSRSSGNAHGTAVALILAASDKAASPGLLPAASVQVAVPYYRSSKGEDIALAYDVVRAIDALVARKVDVINMSLTGQSNEAIERAVMKAKDKGIPVVAAVGNSGARAKPLYPAAYESAVAVTAVSSSLKVYRRAGQGGHVDFAAPGVGLEVQSPRGKIELKTGTSFAVPYVTSALAVMRQARPQTTVDQLVSELARSARDLGDPGKDDTFGWGLVQLAGICRLIQP